MKQSTVVTAGNTKAQYISLSRFKAETGGCRKYTLSGDDPLIPISITGEFDHIAVCISASPYIALRSTSNKICISHIDKIKRVLEEGGTAYTIFCKDYSGSGAPSKTRMLLRCA